MAVDWSTYATGSNTPENLRRKGTLLGAYLTQVAAGWTRTFVAQAAQKLALPPAALDATFIETLVLFVHTCDRIAFDVLGPPLRVPFMEAIEASVREELARATESDVARASRVEMFDALLPIREQEYSEYRTATSAGAGMAGDLFWEFSRRILRAIDPMDDAPMLVFAAAPSVRSELVALDVERLLMDE